MTLRNLTATLAAVVLAAGVAVTVAAQGPGPGGPPPRGMGRGPGPGGPMGPMGGPGGLPGLHALDLTDAQKEQIKAIHEANRDQARQLGERIGEAQRALNEAADGGTVDESDIRAKATQLATAIADGTIHRAKVNAEILSVLTAEQKDKLNEFRAKMQERRQAMQERMKARGERRQQRRGH